MSPRGPEGRSQAHEGSRAEDHQKGEAEDAKVDGDDAGQLAQSFRQQWHEKAPHPPGDHQPGTAACHGEDQALGQQLSNLARPARPQGRANCELLVPCQRLRQQQVGYVDRDDEQKKSYGCQQQHQRALFIAQEDLSDWHSLQRHALIQVELTRQVGELVVRGLQADTRGQASRDVEAPGPQPIRIDAHRQPELGTVRVTHAGGHHPDHRVETARQGHLSPHDLGITTEVPLPGPVTDQCHATRQSARLFLTRETAPQQRLDAQRRGPVFRHPDPHNSLRPLLGLQSEAHEALTHYAFEGTGLVPQRKKHLGAETDSLTALVRHEVDAHQLAVVFERQGSQDGRTEDAENRHIGADPQGQR